MEVLSIKPLWTLDLVPMLMWHWSLLRMVLLGHKGYQIKAECWVCSTTEILATCCSCSLTMALTAEVSLSSCLFTTEAQNGWDCKRPLETVWSKPVVEAGSATTGCPGHCPIAFGVYLQMGTSQSLWDTCVWPLKWSKKGLVLFGIYSDSIKLCASICACCLLSQRVSLIRVCLILLHFLPSAISMYR